MSDIIVVARAKAKAGKEAELEKALRAVIRTTHGEAGCLRYALHRGTEDRGLLVMIEKWTSKVELDMHLQSAHVQALFKKLPELVAEPPELLVLDPLAEGNSEKGKI